MPSRRRFPPLAWAGLAAGLVLPCAFAGSESCRASSGCRSPPAHLPGQTMQAAMLDIDHPAQTHEMTHLLQRRASPQREPEVPPQLAKNLPTAFVHVPKCGTSFVHTMVHLPGVCPSLPEDLFVSHDSFKEGGMSWLDNFIEDYGLPDSCPGLADSDFGHTSLQSHAGYEQAKGNLMIMVRQPEQRMIAAYHDIYAAFKFEPPENLLLDWRSWGGFPHELEEMPTLQEWMKYGSGCTVRMLTREGKPCGGMTGMPTRDEVELAKERLHTDFSFVGLTDDWPLSMCLLSAMFKVKCSASQFTMQRSTRPNAVSGYDVTDLNGTKDVYDGELYEEAVKIFRQRQAEYNVTEAWCWGNCWGPAGVVPVRPGSGENLTTDEWQKIHDHRNYTKHNDVNFH